MVAIPETFGVHENVFSGEEMPPSPQLPESALVPLVEPVIVSPPAGIGVIVPQFGGTVVVVLVLVVTQVRFAVGSGALVVAVSVTLSTHTSCCATPLTAVRPSTHGTVKALPSAAARS